MLRINEKARELAGQDVILEGQDVIQGLHDGSCCPGDFTVSTALILPCVTRYKEANDRVL